VFSARARFWPEFGSWIVRYPFFVQPEAENPPSRKFRRPWHAPLSSSQFAQPVMTPEVSDFTGKPDAMGKLRRVRTRQRSFCRCRCAARFRGIGGGFCCTRACPTLRLRGGVELDASRRRRTSGPVTGCSGAIRICDPCDFFLGHRGSLRPEVSRLEARGRRQVLRLQPSRETGFCGRVFFSWLRLNFLTFDARLLAEGQVRLRVPR